LPKWPLHDQDIRHPIPRLGDPCAALGTDRDLKAFFKSSQINDKNLLKRTMSRRADVSLHDHAIEIFAISIRVARREVVVDRDRGS
jgi:hypothetical protein